jgi:hypothetical protein
MLLMKFDKSLNLFSWHVVRVGFFRAQNKIDIAVALISSGCYIDCLHGCGNIYAQNADDQYHGGDSEPTTFEEEALRDEESDDAESDDNGSDKEITIAAMAEIFSGLTICDVGTSTVDSETEIASLDDDAASGTPTVSVMVMTAKEVAAAAEDETSTASDDETEIASADCLIMGEEEEEEETSPAAPTQLTTTAATIAR